VEPIVGIFGSRAVAESAARALRERGFDEERIQMLLPGETSPAAAENVAPTEDAEAPGMGQAVGGVVGAAAGASAGFGAGALAASLLVPGLGAVTAVGLAAAALFGAAGAIGGVKAGDALEETRTGIPKDELYLYEDALAHGRGVLFVEPRTQEEESTARAVLLSSGAESLEAAREAWWVGIRDTEKAHYDAAGGEFESAEQVYRAGLLGALRPDSRGRTFEEASQDLRRHYGDAVDHAAFRRGYARGQARAKQREEALAETSKA
jgi:hypothetical protein